MKGDEKYPMFNRMKKIAKKFTWHHLRKAQRLSLCSKLGADPRIDSRKLIVSLGTLGIYVSLMSNNDVSSAQKDQFLSYVFERAPRDIHDLLAEYKLDQIDPNSFKQCYSDLSLTCVNAETSGEYFLPVAVIFIIHYALKDEFNDDENLNYVMETYFDEIKYITDMMLS